MATYFHGNSEIQGGGDGLQTLILMNPGYVGYAGAQQPPQGSNFVFFNSSSAGGDGEELAQAPQSQSQRFVGVPLHSVGSSSAQEDAATAHGIFAHLYNLPVDFTAAREVTRTQQGLTLSLSSQQPLGYGGFGPEREAPLQQMVGGGEVRALGESPLSASAVSNGATVLLESKYLKSAQKLLDEAVNVGKAANSDAKSSKTAAQRDSSPCAAIATSDGESSIKRGAELSNAERQDIQMKKAKLVNMLDEVDQRYRQYHHQMQSVISWFERAAGVGSAKSYTALALQTISKQFRCLKDAILGQIRAASRSLGEDENLAGKTEGSRLKYVDNQIRQQRALQQLGVIQNNAWRPQRGLPERSVSVLRAWLFEHFLHPYPKDSDKVMLAKQTGLTRSQVSNWFINARVRLWKPMVEEMYAEEMKEQGRRSDSEKTEHNDDPAPEKKIDNPPPAMSTPSSAAAASPTGISNFSGFNLIVPPPPSSSGLESISQPAAKKLRHATDVLHSPAIHDKENSNSAIKFTADGQSGQEFTLMAAPANFIGGFGSYPIGELGRFGSDQFSTPFSWNGGVSLTLGLPHCDNHSFLPSQSIQLGRELEIGDGTSFATINPPAAALPSNVFESINIQHRKRFPEQLLPDFVA